jgi:transcriptional regulator with XRE-family HTH domain
LSTLKKQLGARVRELRKKLRWTQADLAERVSLSVNMIGYIERGERFPSPETFVKLADVLGVQVWDLFSFPPKSCEEDPARRTAVRELDELLKGTPTKFIRTVLEIISASRQLLKKQ